MVAETDELTDETSPKAPCCQAAVQAALDQAANDIENLSASEILLATGEMNAREMRTVRAVLNWRARVLRIAAEATRQATPCA